MRKLIGVTAIILGLSGCVQSKIIWDKEGGTQAGINKDNYQCEKDARQSVYTADASEAVAFFLKHGGDLKHTAHIGDDLKFMKQAAMKSFFMKCMVSKGYTARP